MQPTAFNMYFHSLFTADVLLIAGWCLYKVMQLLINAAQLSRKRLLKQAATPCLPTIPAEGTDASNLAVVT
jgi:hypothetical protein